MKYINKMLRRRGKMLSGSLGWSSWGQWGCHGADDRGRCLFRRLLLHHHLLSFAFLSGGGEGEMLFPQRQRERQQVKGHLMKRQRITGEAQVKQAGNRRAARLCKLGGRSNYCKCTNNRSNNRNNNCNSPLRVWLTRVSSIHFPRVWLVWLV